MATFGEFLIFAAFGCTIFSLVLYFLAWRGSNKTVSVARGFFLVSTVCLVGALGTLLYLFLTHDFSVAYVQAYSSTDLPLYYLIASLWGGQEGTFLLWLVFTTIIGTVMMRTAGSFERGNMTILNLFVLSLLLILLKRNPFELLPVAQTEGAGLNPLLQNFWMTIHPPIMFVGFAGAVFPFCFAITALVEKRFNSWAESARRWTLFAWCALGVSLTMGGYWAYVTLGWGGFWAWDPVENSSFIPWIFLTTQVHALFIKRQRNGLMRFSLFMVCLTFWSVLYGTFLTRSGVLADFSVHSFVELGINNFLIGSLLFFVLGGVFLIFWRWRDIDSKPSYATVSSRSYIVSLGVIILFIGGVLTLLGTSAPLLTRFGDNPSAVGLEYYFATMTPVAVALLILLTLFPAFRWNEGVSKKRLLLIGGIAALVTIAILLLAGVTYEPIYLLLFGAAVSAVITNGYVFYGSWRDGNFKPAYLAHVGLAIAVVGAAVSAGFETKETLNLPQGKPIDAMGYTLTFTHATDTEKGFDCHVQVQEGDHMFEADLPHEFPKNGQGVMRKPHVEKYLDHDLYLAPVAIDQPDSEGPGFLPLLKGESKTIDKYTFTFNGFEVDGHNDSMPTQAAALVTVAYGDKKEDIRPILVIRGDTVVPEAANFDAQNGQVMIEGIRPEEGGVVLRVHGAFLPSADLQVATLTMELSKKPLINLFWFGTFLLFVSGGLSMRERRRRLASQKAAEAPIHHTGSSVADHPQAAYKRT